MVKILHTFTVFTMLGKFAPITVQGLKLKPRLNNRVRHLFNDARLSVCFQELFARMHQEQSAVVHRIAKDRAQMLRFYGFLRNKRVCVREMIQQQCSFANICLEGRHVLVLGDNTSFNLKNHVKRISDLSKIGVLADNQTPGFFVQANLAVDAQTKHVLGLSDLLFWCRWRAEKTAKDAKVALKADERESQKWVLGTQNSYEVLQQAAQITFVFDREADDFRLFETVRGMHKAHFIVRSFRDRFVTQQGKRLKMSDCLQKSPVLGIYEIDLPALDHYSSTNGKRVKRSARRAQIQFRACPVQLPLPSNLKAAAEFEPMVVCVVQAQEITPDLPANEEPINWTLLTSHLANTPEQALQIIHYYMQRWMIEQLFRAMKKEGFEIEATELETFEAILKQTAMAFQAATKVLQLVYARNRYDSQPIDEVFNQQEQQVLRKLNQKFQGTTESQLNPFPKNQTSWATWVIARLGGWKGYLSQRPPGPTTLKRGLEKFAVWVNAFSAFSDDG